MSKIDEYYNKFNEDKRLTTRRGQVEFITTMKYLHKYLTPNNKILDVGAGTGKYSLALFDEGYDVTAVELVKHNLEVIKTKNKDIKAMQGNAIDLTKFDDNTFDIVLLFGPLYHLKTLDEKVQALKEAKRVVKPNGLIMTSYFMNEYAVITHGFKDGFIKESIKSFDKTYHITESGNELYSYIRLDDINKLNQQANLERIEIIAQDGPASYIKEQLNKMDEEEFDLFLKYHFATCERPELLGASTHLLDIVKKI